MATKREIACRKGCPPISLRGVSSALDWKSVALGAVVSGVVLFYVNRFLVRLHSSEASK